MPLERFVPKKLQPKLALRMLLDCLKGLSDTAFQPDCGDYRPRWGVPGRSDVLGGTGVNRADFNRGTGKNTKVFQRQMLDLYGAPILVGTT